MITLMKEKSALVAVLLGLLGIVGGIIIAFVATWGLGVGAGIAAVVVAYLAYLTAQRMTLAEERTQRLEHQVNELEGAVANQIQARMSAEEDARKANLRAETAETGAQLATKSANAEAASTPTSAAAAATDGSTETAPLVIAGGSAVEGDRITDQETGLYAEHYFLANVEQRVSAARRHLRPVAVALIEVVTDPNGKPITHVDPNEVTAALIETLREADTACRLDDGRYALILEDTPENGAIWTIERLRRRLADSVELSTLWAGVSCYPAHGFDTEEILAQAEVALTAARDWPQDRIEVAEAR